MCAGFLKGGSDDGENTSAYIFVLSDYSSGINTYK